MRGRATGFRHILTSGVLLGMVIALMAGPATARPADQAGAAAHWTAERREAAQPRDLVLDERGLGYLRRADGSLEPYGHTTAARIPTLRAVPVPRKPGNGGGGGGGTADTTPPAVTEMSPAGGAVLGSESITFSARVTDASGIKSVSFVIRYPDGRQQSFSPTASGDVWSITLSGFSAGTWGWHVVAKDNAPRGGNTTTTDWSAFTVELTSTPPPDGGGGGQQPGATIANAVYNLGGSAQLAVGRIYFEMPANRAATRWSGYVCSGTAVQDGNTVGRSIILTAAHCVYDDVNKVFARNVIFIPDQAGTAGTETDRNCGNDPIGCWSTSHGVVDVQWTTRRWPDNIPWDYAYYVVDDTGAHQPGLTAPSSAALDGAVPPLPIQFSATTPGAYTHGIGYSYSEDPKLMYCAEGLSTDGTGLFLPSCGLSGGSSGGPWVSPLNNGTGPIVSVNSYGYSNQPGMGGPRLTGSAACVFTAAKGTTANTARGHAVSC